MTEQVLTSLSIVTTLLVCLNGVHIARYFGVMAYPDSRRLHKAPTPQVGGLAILAGLSVWLGGQIVLSSSRFAMGLLLTGLGAGLVGFVDDRREMSPQGRILLLLIFMGVAFALVPGLISPTLNWFSFVPTQVNLFIYLPLMGLAAIGVVNSVNMADGQNALVGTMFAVWSACIVLASSGTVAGIAAIILILSAVFLLFNWNGKVFLGDCGTYGVTFILGLLVTYCHARRQLPLETIIVWFFIPVMDCLRLLIARPLQGRSVFDGGRDHFHHRLMESFGNRWSASVYLLAVAVPSFSATLFPHLSLVALCFLCAFYCSFARFSEGGSQVIERDDKAANRVVRLQDARERQ